MVELIDGGFIMRKIMVLNAKGGSGKTTVATNLAAYYASIGKNVLLADYDPQESSMRWLDERPQSRAMIKGNVAHDGGAVQARGTDIVIMDAPASIHGKDLEKYTKRADTFIIPVLPSPIDMRAAASFIKELKNTSAIKGKKTKFCVVANRARGHTNIFLDLDNFLDDLKGVPYITALRENSNYIKSATTGVGILELYNKATAVDREEWKPLLDWIGIK